MHAYRFLFKPVLFCSQKSLKTLKNFRKKKPHTHTHRSMLWIFITWRKICILALGVFCNLVNLSYQILSKDCRKNVPGMLTILIPPYLSWWTFTHVHYHQRALTTSVSDWQLPVIVSCLSIRSISTESIAVLTLFLVPMLHHSNVLARQHHCDVTQTRWRVRITRIWAQIYHKSLRIRVLKGSMRAHVGGLSWLTHWCERSTPPPHPPHPTAGVGGGATLTPKFTSLWIY